MSNDLLALHFESAKAAGKLGDVYLIHQANAGREKPAQFDLTGVSIPEQEKALEFFRDAKSAKSTAENTWSEALGSRVGFAAKVNAARGV